LVLPSGIERRLGSSDAFVREFEVACGLSKEGVKYGILYYNVWHCYLPTSA
jgi:hypothetical protein